MSLHYLDERRRPRECPCAYDLDDVTGDLHATGGLDCEHGCNGTGQLGEPGAKPDVLIDKLGGYYKAWIYSRSDLGWIGKEDTPEAALSAARRAAGIEERKG